jgi:hypothetical protein
VAVITPEDVDRIINNIGKKVDQTEELAQLNNQLHVAD